MVKKISILGSCVSRDAFNLSQGNYTVALNIQRNPVKTMFGLPLKFDENTYACAGGGGSPVCFNVVVKS